ELIYAPFRLVAPPERVKPRRQSAFLELKGDFIIAHLPYVDTVAREAAIRLASLQSSDQVRVLRKRHITTVKDPLEVWGLEINGQEVLSYATLAGEHERRQQLIFNLILFATVAAAVARLSLSKRGLWLLSNAA
ncbi:MAG: hypothetical protein LW847_04180, partial [Burkholderiales bacterium]|nr:hypothetical protein [Burkholderiales bacterium]